MTALNALQKHFGYDSFRPMQEEIIQAVFNKRDALVLMPTGGGKSVCYQIPAITTPGTCMVVSPLISLMKDQVEALRANGIRAAFLNSSLAYREQRKVEDDLFYGRLDLVYVSPEKICSQEFLPILRKVNVNLLAIDEAHCISSWGHDFRPEYTRLKFLKKEFPNIPTLALTATADKATRTDIVKQLELNDPAIFVASFDRPNLSLEVRPGRKRLEQIIAFIKERPNQAGIIYCLSRNSTEKVCATLLDNGIEAAFYHAGMQAAERSKVQENFINDVQPVICATVAFGMGIDKSNVRWIMHYNLPKNIESFYQEIGRSGRDGVKAETLLFYSFGDVITLREMLEKNESEYKEIKLAKLNRMYQYATCVTCRRKVLLNYFGENLKQDCGNCDICHNPPDKIDGTVIAQMALSAIARLKENVATGMLIDVLRGSKRKDLFRWGYHRIKTYSLGKKYSYKEWQSYLEQLLNKGFIEIAFEDYNKVKLTQASRAVLFDGKKVELVNAETIRKRRQAELAQSEALQRKQSARRRVRDELFEHLRQLRLDIARKNSLPPYIVFSDATLEEMAAERPANMEAMNQISGIGEVKLREYGRIFLDAIQDFILKKKEEGIPVKGATYLQTLQLYKQGLTVAQIAEQRELSPITIFSHFAYLYERGENIQLGKFVSKEEVKKVLDVLPSLEQPYKMKEIFDSLKEEVSYDKIRMALAYFNRHELKSERF